jgi:hypothetical protein
MLDACRKGRALMGGTEAMRKAGKVYLPQFAAESEDAYQARLAASWLFNGLRKTVRDMTGRVFAKSVEVTDAPDQIEGWTENVDMQGQDLSMFANRVFADALSGPGIAWIMVDAPQRDATVTVAQAQAQNLRPYMVHLSIEEVLGWKAQTVNNVMTVTQVRLHETVSEQDPEDPFATAPVEQIRVLTLTDVGVETTIYRKVGKTDEWALYAEPTYSAMTEITIAPVYLNRAGFWEAMPPLEDLADVNIAHWQSQSDQRNILHVARVPILHAAGRMSEDGPITIGASHAVASADPAAKLEWVEHSGAAIGAGRQDLKDLEYQMEALGLQLLAPKAQQSATGEAIDNAKETSQLAMMADALQDALEQAVRWMGAYSGLDATEARVVVNKEFGVTMMTAQEVTALHTAVTAGNLSRQTFIGELARRGVIAPDIDPEDETERIDSEGPRMSGNPLDLDGTSG